MEIIGKLSAHQNGPELNGNGKMRTKHEWWKSLETWPFWCSINRLTKMAKNGYLCCWVAKCTTAMPILILLCGTEMPYEKGEVIFKSKMLISWPQRRGNPSDSQEHGSTNWPKTFTLFCGCLGILESFSVECQPNWLREKRRFSVDCQKCAEFVLIYLTTFIIYDIYTHSATCELKVEDMTS